MDSERSKKCHVVAMPYPGRGHINPMMSLCSLISSSVSVEGRDYILIFTFVVTEEWLGFISSDPKPSNIRFETLPNVIPSELVRAADFLRFVKATQTELEAPFEQLLNRLDPPPAAIIADAYLGWAVGVGNRRRIPVASLWPMSPTVFTLTDCFDLIHAHGHYPVELSGGMIDFFFFLGLIKGDEHVDYIPGISSSMQVADLPTIFQSGNQELVRFASHVISQVPKAQCLIFNSIYELEACVLNTLKAKFPFPVYTVGPVIPYLNLQNNNVTQENDPNYWEWLDSQPRSSVLYVSLGSFLSVSSAQLDEIAAGLRDSGIRHLWVARGETHKLRASCGNQGIVVPWCDQLKVLCHPSVGGFWSHCGWNSTLDSVYAGLPTMTIPIFWDQVPNSWLLVEEWKMGWRVKKESGADKLVTKEEIAGLVRRFMDLEGSEGREMRCRAKEFQKTCRQAIEKGGSSATDLGAFVRKILEWCNT